MLRAGQTIAICVLALLTLGVVMVNSAGMAVSPIGAEVDAEGITPRSIIFSRSTVYMVVACGAFAAAAFSPVRRLTGRQWTVDNGQWKVDNRNEPGIPSGCPLSTVHCPLSPERGLAVAGVVTLGLVAILGLVYVPGLGREVNASSRWIALPIAGGLSVQPSEIAKWGLIGLMAWLAAQRAALMPRFCLGLAPALLLTGIVAGLVVIEDLGTGVLIAAAASVVLLAGGARLLHFAIIVPFGLLGIVGAIVVSPYRVRRLTAFLDPFADPQGAGYHMIQSMAAVAGGEGWGRGLGHGIQKFGYLPEDQTDFLFAIICEELGIAGAALVVGLYACLLITGMVIVRREPAPFLKLLGIGVLATVGLQAIINLAVVTGLGPTKGIALPLLSSGGTGWVLTAAALGLLAAMDRTQPTPADDDEAQPDAEAVPAMP